MKKFVIAAIAVIFTLFFWSPDQKSNSVIMEGVKLQPASTNHDFRIGEKRYVDNMVYYIDPEMPDYVVCEPVTNVAEWTKMINEGNGPEADPAIADDGVNERFVGFNPLLECRKKIHAVQNDMAITTTEY